ncbi:vWA domain-containing protein [Sulfurimonas marina]|uniref:VWA domain-containing protein n=1 Tax=Sulfurimonas marina TaxID=2590551 RepID=A0A7M1AW37_9BACT|nr:VWA domain-containing protein [Sulfurimonas marina]QOP41681.1 VWA domain-containing protein [Sulfurimonas marina]
MSFLSPEYFWLLLFLIAALVKNDLKFSSFRMLSYLLSFVLLVIALARPVIEQKPIKSEELLSDVVLGIDLSYSMHSDDIKPTRLKFAKQQLEQLVKSEQKSRFGVLGFTTNAIILSPLTGDSELLLHLFSSLDENMILTKGSSILPALKLARKISSAKKVSVVLFSDGGDQKDFTKEIQFAKENNLIVNLFMSATSFGGTLKTKDGSLLQDENGEIVVSRENGEIEALSSATGGVYTKELSAIKDALSNQRDENIMQENTIVQNRELYYYFVAVALILFLVGNTTLKKYILPLLLVVGIEMQASVLDFAKNENYLAFSRGISNYQAGKYEEAIGDFSLVRSNKADIKAIVYYNKGNCFVRLKQFSKARVEYLKSLALEYSREADENLQHIKGVPDNTEMSTGMQKSKKNKELASERKNSQNAQSGGASNMKIETSSSGAGGGGKKIKSSLAKMDLGTSKSKLSSTQYELINKRGVSEKKPW